MIQGMVQRITSRQAGGKTWYSTQVEGAWYGLGLASPKFKEGDQIEFENKVNAKGFNDAIGATIKVLSQPTNVVTQGKPAAAVGSNGQSGYWDRKEQRDLKQDELRELGATRNTAIDFINLLLTKEALKLPTKIADREDFLKALLNDYVDYFRGFHRPTLDKVEAIINKPENETKGEEDAPAWE